MEKKVIESVVNIHQSALQELDPNSVYSRLFSHMAAEHGLTLLQSEMEEIIKIVQESKLWYVGQPVWSDKYQKGVVASLSESCGLFPIVVLFDKGNVKSYTLHGEEYLDKPRSLFPYNNQDL